MTFSSPTMSCRDLIRKSQMLTHLHVPWFHRLRSYIFKCLMFVRMNIEHSEEKIHLNDYNTTLKDIFQSNSSAQLLIKKYILPHYNGIKLYNNVSK